MFVSRLDIQVRMYCEANYYGSSCSTYCLAQDSSRGHYVCDDKTGDKICHKGQTIIGYLPCWLEAFYV